MKQLDGTDWKQGFRIESDGTCAGTKVYDSTGEVMGGITRLAIVFDGNVMYPEIEVAYATPVCGSGDGDGCAHPEDDVQTIGDFVCEGEEGFILWCSRCGAWRYDSGKWNAPDRERENARPHRRAP